MGSFRLSPYRQPAHIAPAAGMDYYLAKKEEASTTINTINQWGDTMAENKTQDYFDDNDQGHVDTREANFTCENPDRHLGCDLNIDVMG